MSRTPAPVDPPVVLTIAGSDSGGGAGVQADLKTVEAGGAFGTSAVTAVTAQHTRGVESTHLLPREEIEAQIAAVTGDFDVEAVKTGMLATSEVVELVAERAPDLPNLVVDPVMVAESGDRLLDRDAEATYEELIAHARVVTPNAAETEVLTGIDVTDVDAARDAGDRLVELGADAALVTGGHVPGDDVVDVLVTDEETHTFRHARVDTDATHGSGCTISSAIATRLAHGDDLPTAVGEAVSLLSAAVRYHADVGEGAGAVHHAVQARNEAARERTADALERVVSALAAGDDRPPLPDPATSVVGATPYAERQADVAGVEGGLGTTRSGLRANRGVRFGADDRLGEVLLAVRERDPATRFAAEIRNTDGVREALSTLEGATATLPADDGPVEAQVRRTLEGMDDAPAALRRTGPGGGRVTVLAPSGDELVERLWLIGRATED